MAMISTKHTFAALNIIKKQLANFITIISIICTIIFFGYYIYSIYNYINNLPYLISYIVLFLTVLISFIIELIFSDKKYKSRKEKRLDIEEKRKIKFIVKCFKYLAKSVTIGLGIYSIFIIEKSHLSIALTIFSCVVLVISLFFEIIIFFVNKYIDYLRLGFEMDFDDSFVVRIIARKIYKAKKKSKKEYKKKREDPYTVQERKMINLLTETAELMEKEKIKKELDEELKKLSEEDRVRIEQQFETSQKEAGEIIHIPEKIDKLLDGVKKIMENLPKEVKILNYIPDLLSLVNNYVSKKYTGVSLKSIIAVLAMFVYLVSTRDAIPDFMPKVGYLDDTYLIGKCIDLIEDDLEKFVKWRDKNQVTC